MKSSTLSFSLPAAALLASLTIGTANPAFAQIAPRRPHVVVPASSLERSEDRGMRSHTNILILHPPASIAPAAKFGPMTGTPLPGTFYETPASIGCLYKLTKLVKGCNPNTATANPTGGFGAIAIVDAFDYPTAAADLATFSTQFGLPVPTSKTFSVVYASGTKPPQDPTGGWELEEALDIEWAHAMAPSAQIILVEAKSNNNSDLFNAVTKAAALVNAAGGGEVTMSWGGAEFSAETSSDSLFVESGVVFFASTGDSQGTIYPSTSPNVVAAGGTTISRNPITGLFQAELAWNSAGGGPSTVEHRPSYQNGIESIVGNARGVPDLSFDADPVTGVLVLDSIPVANEGGGPNTWWILGGTSVSSPALAGIVNAAGSKNTSSEAELTEIYNKLGTVDFADTIKGSCYFYDGYLAVKGWDFCTGVGSVKGKVGK
jgi:kumamolisin